MTNARWRSPSRRSRAVRGRKPSPSGPTARACRSSPTRRRSTTPPASSRRRQHAGGHFGPQARRGGLPAPCGDRRIVGRRHHQQGSERHHHQLEQGRRAAVRLHGRRNRSASRSCMLIPGRPASTKSTAILYSIRRGERIDHYETVRRRKDGSLVDISLTVSPVKNAEGRVIGASKIARDITDRKRAAGTAEASAARDEASHQEHACDGAGDRVADHEGRVAAERRRRSLRGCRRLRRA